MKESAATKKPRNCTPLFLSALLAVLCTLGQSDNVEGIIRTSPELGPLGPNPLALQADPNFLRFGRSSNGGAAAQQHQQNNYNDGDDELEAANSQWKRAPAPKSANFLRFGKAVPSEPNFLRFGKSVVPPQEAKKRLISQQQQQLKSSSSSGAVDPSFLRFGRAGHASTNNFLRFGRTPTGEDPLVATEEAFEREYRQPNPNFLRFG